MNVKDFLRLHGHRSFKTDREKSVAENDRAWMCLEKSVPFSNQAQYRPNILHPGVPSAFA